MGRHPLVSGAALAAVLLLACSRTHPAETMSAIRSVTPPAPAMGMDLAAPRLTAPGRHVQTVAPGTTPVDAPTAASATTASTSGRTAAGCPPITPAIVEAGRRIFTGLGNCYACHGADASGTAMAPTLHAHKWLNIDGSYASIVGLVTRGVSTPKAHPEAMPPMGGASLSSSQVCAVAANVYSLSQPPATPRAAAHAAPSPASTAASASDAPSVSMRSRAAAHAAPAPASTPTSASDAPSVSMRSGKMQITFSGTPENYTIRVENPDGRTSSTYGYSAGAAAAPAEASTARPVAAAAAAGAAAAPDVVTAAPAATASATRAPACPPIAPAVIAEGRKIFAGPGNCYACHGDNAKGTPMAPSLGAHAWLNIDGSYASIAELVTSGVPKPKAHPAPMPAKGGAQLSEKQVCAVAGYVYSVSR